MMANAAAGDVVWRWHAGRVQVLKILAVEPIPVHTYHCRLYHELADIPTPDDLTCLAVDREHLLAYGPFADECFDRLTHLPVTADELAPVERVLAERREHEHSLLRQAAAEQTGRLATGGLVAVRQSLRDGVHLPPFALGMRPDGQLTLVRECAPISDVGV